MNAFVNLRLWGERVIGFLYLQTDKASMLDEAIEYLKQLQLQVQVSLMWSPSVSLEDFSLSARRPCPRYFKLFSDVGISFSIQWVVFLPWLQSLEGLLIYMKKKLARILPL